MEKKHRERERDHLKSTYIPTIREAVLCTVDGAKKNSISILQSNRKIGILHAQFVIGHRFGVHICYARKKETLTHPSNQPTVRFFHLAS